MGFTTSCYIDILDEKVRTCIIDWLRENGQEADFDPSGTILVHSDKSCFLKDMVNCHGNIDLFKALTSMRDDTCKNQWYISNDGCMRFSMSHNRNYKFLPNDVWRRATAQEIHDYFIPNKDTLDKIKQWVIDRNLQTQDPRIQMCKMVEELGETAKAINKYQTTGDQRWFDEIKDGIGDSVVVLTCLAKQVGLDIHECIDAAYNEIKDRKGKLINGTFVKESDLVKN